MRTRVLADCIEVGLKSKRHELTTSERDTLTTQHNSLDSLELASRPPDESVGSGRPTGDHEDDDRGGKAAPRQSGTAFSPRQPDPPFARRAFFVDSSLSRLCT